MEEILNLAKHIEQAFTCSARKHNRIISQEVYPFARSLKNDNLQDYIAKLTVLLEYNHPFVQYWGAVIALSYHLLEKESLTILLNIVDFTVESKPYEERTEQEKEFLMKMGLLQGDAETSLVELYRTGKIGSYPGQIKDRDFQLCNPNSAIRHFRRKVKKL